MPTIRSAAALLASAVDVASLAPIAAAVGCSGPPAPLDAAARAALGIPDHVSHARIASGPGTLRALLLELASDRPVREVVGQLASRLTARAPHLLWLAVAVAPATGHVVIAAWTPGRSGARVAALVVERARVVDSDAETLCALAAAIEPVDVLTHARWQAVLGREAVTRRFYRSLERLVGQLAETAIGRAGAEPRREIALLYASRLLFLSFLEAKGWLDGDRAFLARRFDACMEARGGFQRRVLVPLFYGTLNTPIAKRAPTARALGRVPFLNGGLFSRAPVERLHRNLVFGDEALGLLFAELLSRYRFTAREESTDWSEAAVDPEMLGRAFESLMASRARRDTGAFFTPHELVVRVTDCALEKALGTPLTTLTEVGRLVRDVGTVRRNAGRVEHDGGDCASGIRSRLLSLRIIDPACGSGAFLVNALERCAQLLSDVGDPRPIAYLRRAVLTTSIFGVDVNSTAVWLCQLRLWLSIVIDSVAPDPLRIVPLPNLDRNIRVGDALVGDDVARWRPVPTGNIARLRQRYVRAVGARKHTLARELDRFERAQALSTIQRRIETIDASRREILLAARSPDLFGNRAAPSSATRAALADLRADGRALRVRRQSLTAGGALPFSFVTHFADVVAAGGFDVVVGNPPWVRVHRIPTTARSGLRRDYAVYRHAAWQAGAANARAGTGFAAQVDLATLFLERSLAIARPRGVVALLLPAKLWRSLAGGGARALLCTDHSVEHLEDWSDAPAMFDAAVYPSLIVVTRGRPDSTAPQPAASITVHSARVAAAWCAQPGELAFDDSPGAPWVLLPPLARRAFDAMRGAGTPLAATPFGAPMLGVKSGCNGAFIVSGGEGRLVAETGAVVEIERELLRPLVRGEGVTRWRLADAGERIIWTHGRGGQPLERLPPRAERWFRGWRRRLLARADGRNASRWWTLFRTESASCDATRVVWADFGKRPKAAVVAALDPVVPLNTCYVVRCADARDAFALAAVLNSPLASAWLAPIAEPARGGFRRYLGWTMSLLPVPAEWAAAIELLAPLGERGVRGDPPSDVELLEAVTRAFGLSLRRVRPLLDWSTR